VLGIIACSTIASLSMTLAAAYFIFGSLNIVTSIVCGLLIGMYVDYCILTLKRFGDEMLITGNRQSALEMTMKKAGASMFMSAITTSLSFFSIILTRFDGLYQLGIVSGIGVMLCFSVTFFFMNSLLVLISARGADRILASNAPSSGVEGISKLIRTYPRRVVIISAVAVVFLLAGIKNITFDNNPEHVGIRDSEAISTMKTLNKKLRNSGEPMQVLIKANSIEALTARFDKLEQELGEWKKEGLISQYDSLSTLLPPPNKQIGVIKQLGRSTGQRGINAKSVETVLLSECKDYDIICDKQALKGYVAAIANALNRQSVIGLSGIGETKDPAVKRFYNRQDISMVAYLYSGSTGWTEQSKILLKERVARAGEGWYLLGTSMLYDEIKASILWGSALAAIATLSLNLLFIIIFLRKIRYSLLAMIPVCLGFLLTPAIMGWLGTSFNFINIGTMALIFGFGVDYGIYIMQSYLREDVMDIDNAMRLSGKNVMMCAATTIAGCGSLITASFAGIASIGLVLTIGAICCSSITLILLPSLMWLNKGRISDGKI
jgi:uncharacterized protein